MLNIYAYANSKTYNTIYNGKYISTSITGTALTWETHSDNCVYNADQNIYLYSM
jgi:hypothetical protein